MATIGTLVAVAAGATVTVLVTRSNDDPFAATARTTPVRTITTTVTERHTRTATVTTPAPETVAAASAPPSGEKRSSAPVTSTRQQYIAQLGSHTDRTEADGHAAQLRAAGLAPQVGRSDAYPELRPGFWVVYLGPYTAEREAASAVADAKRAGTSDALVRHVTAAAQG